ncbi:hypothetical protein BaRGS_00008441, partial [Batillaria attramentaria]
RYWGVGSVTEDDTLVVSCVKDKEGPACVDVVSRSGAVLKTVIDGSSLAGLSWPHYVCVCDRDALISDFDSSGVFRVARVDKDRISPFQICVMPVAKSVSAYHPIREMCSVSSCTLRVPVSQFLAQL